MVNDIPQNEFCTESTTLPFNADANKPVDFALSMRISDGHC